MLKYLVLLLSLFIDAARLGVIADGRTDNTTVLQQIVDLLPNGGSIDLPPGIILTRYPVYVDKPNLHIKGAGSGVTILKPLYGEIPPLIYGVRRVEGNNQVVTANHRPDVNGLLDWTVAPVKGYFRGFSTQGNAYAIVVANPLQFGRISPLSGGRVFDGYGTLDEMTIEVAARFNNGIPKGCTFLGLGQSQNPGPWILSFDANGLLTCTFKTTTNNDIHVFRAVIPESTNPVRRFRVWFKFKEKIPCGIAIDGVDCPLVFNNLIDGPLDRFQRNLGQYPFFLGPGSGPTIGSLQMAQVPNFDILGLKVSNVAVTTERLNDKQRYVPDWDDFTAIYFLNGLGPINRTIEFGCCRATAIPVCSGVIVNTNGSIGGIYNNKISDLTVQGGGILVGQVLDFQANNVEAGGFVGIASFPLGMNYPVILENCRVGGYHAGLSFTRSFVWLRNTNVNGSGMASMIFTGCNVSVDNSLFSHFSPEAETGILALPDESGGRMLLRNIEVDNEEYLLPSAVKVHLAPYGPITYVNIDSLGLAQIAKDRPIVDLVGNSTSPGIIKYSGLVSSVGAIPVSIGPGWSIEKTTLNLEKSK